MRIEGYTTSVTNAQTANVALSLVGIDEDLTGQKFKSPRVREDETGFELTYKAQLHISAASPYVVGSDNRDVDGVLILTGANPVATFSADLVTGTNYSVCGLAGQVHLLPDEGVDFIFPVGFASGFTRDAGSVVQLKKIDGNTFLVFGDLEEG